MSNDRDAINSLINKAEKTHDSADAVKFTQAALNIAHILVNLAMIDKENKTNKVS